MSKTGVVDSNAIELTEVTFNSTNVSDKSEREDNLVSQPRTYPEGGWRAYSVVFGSFIGLIANFGTLNSVGAIQTYVAVHQLEGVATSTISWIFSIYMCLSFAIGVVVGPYFDKYGAFRPLVLGCILQTVGFMCTAVSSEVWHFVMAFSVCVGLGNALCITPLISVISHWFLNKRGRATGLATMGGSIGGVVIPLMLRSLYSSVGYAWAIRILGFFCLSCMITCITLVRDRVDPTDKLKSKPAKYFGLAEIFDMSVLRDLKFSFLILGNFATELALLSIMTYYPTYAIAQGMAEESSYLLLTIFNATGVLGRLLPGYLSDKIGHFNVMILMLIGVILSIFLMWIPFGYNLKVLYGFAGICGFFSSSILSLTPVALSQIVPVNVFGARYGLMYFFVCSANLFGIPLAAAIIGNGSQYRYTLFASFCGIFTVVGTIFWYISRYYIVKFKFNVKI